jgi:hypothetical protein
MKNTGNIPRIFQWRATALFFLSAWICVAVMEATSPRFVDTHSREIDSFIELLATHFSPEEKHLIVGFEFRDDNVFLEAALGRIVQPLVEKYSLNEPGEDLFQSYLVERLRRHARGERE